MHPDDRVPSRPFARLRPWMALIVPLATACAQVNEELGAYGSDVPGVTADEGATEDVGEVIDVPTVDAPTSVDAGPRDVGVVDEGASDVGTPDSGPRDVGVLDAGPRDVGTPDTGPRDVGTPDTGPRDVGVLDTGPRDVGTPDTGPRDVGTPDTGPRDVGTPDTGPPPECAVGASRICYTGPAATRRVGLCVDGIEQCAAGRWSGRCEGQRTPTTEVCGNADDEDCNGRVDAACSTPTSRFSQGNVHACWLDDSAQAWCWGGNFYGQTTFTTTSGSPSAERAPSFDGVMLAAGEYFECVLRSDRTVQCSGLNGSGQLGDGTTTNRLSTVAVTGLTGVTSIAAGYKHACAVVTGGAVRCWGLNDRRQLGATCIGTDCNARPLTVPGVTGATQLALGHQHTCALRSDGTVTCWGDNTAGELGLGTEGAAMAAPATVPGLTGVRAIEGGYSHTCALLGDGTVTCWGANNYGQVGDGTNVNRSAPAPVAGLRGVERLVVGMHHGCGLVSGRLWCWGYNSNGQLGDGTTTSRSTPVMASVVGITDFGAGYWHTCARSAGTTLWCWGWNLSGMLGSGSTTPSQSLTPLRVAF